MEATKGKNYRIPLEIVTILEKYVDDLRKDTPSMQPATVCAAALVGFFDLDDEQREDLIGRAMFYTRRRRRRDAVAATESPEGGKADLPPPGELIAGMKEQLPGTEKTLKPKSRSKKANEA